MAILTGSCRFGLWHVHVAWLDDFIYREIGRAHV